MDSTIGRTGPDRHYRQSLRRQTVDPLGRWDRLAGFEVGSQRRPIALALDPFVRDGTLHNQNKRIQLAFLCPVPILHEVVAIFIGQDGIVQMDFGKPRYGPQKNVLNARLGSGGDRDGITIAAQTGGDPKDMNFRDRGRSLSDVPIRNAFRWHTWPPTVAIVKKSVGLAQSGAGLYFFS